ncbi:protein JINGUBANG-like [Abrus precatorius]|uniref:Protein JINGUBANG-like n=1 Tax=Abrus precatorius TaxID=3816 RepID=A0A8B8K393_ABRPR|nr:protein JINGUBANG-like [Abrus precatorius]
MDQYQRSYSVPSSSHSNNHQPGLTSLTSQRSLISIPSLNNSKSHHNNTSITSNNHYCLTTLKGHTSYISSLTLSGKFLYTGSSDREIRSWNRTPFLSESPNSTYNIVVAGEGAVKSLVIQSDKLFSAHQDHKIRVWKITNSNHQPEQQKYTHLATLPTLGDRASKVLIPKNHVQIRRHKKCTWVHHVDTVSSLALSQDGTLLYSVSWDRTIKIWRTKDFTCLESVTNAHEDAINAVVVSYDGVVYTGSADKRIKVWKKNQGEKKHTLLDTLEKHNSGINALALSSDETLLYSGACDRSILVWEKEEGGDGKMGVVGALRGHTKSILCLAVVADLVCSGSADTTIRIWRGVYREEYSCLAVLEGHKGSIKCLTAVVDHWNTSESQASFLVYSGSLDCDIKVWQILVPAS